MSRGTKPGTVSLFVRNVHADTRVEDMRKMFAKYGSVSDVYIPLDFYTREPRGFAYIQFDDMRDAEDAVHYLDGVELLGRTLDVQFAEGGRKTSYQMKSRDRDDYGGRRRSRSRSPRRRSRSPRRRRSRSPRGRSPRARSPRGRSPRDSRSRYDRRRRSYSKSPSRSPSRDRSRSLTPHSRSASRERSPYR